MESEFFDLIILLSFTTYWFYKLNRIWFHTDEEYLKALKRKEWMPKIFNSERFIVDDKNAWIALVKTSSIITSVIVVLVNIILLPQLIFGN